MGFGLKLFLPVNGDATFMQNVVIIGMLTVALSAKHTTAKSYTTTKLKSDEQNQAHRSILD